MFPFDIDDDEVAISSSDEKIPADYEIDFVTGKLTGNIITGVEAIKQWVIIALSIPRYKFNQYTWDNGSELYSLIGKVMSADMANTEAERIITDTLSVNEFITGISDFESTLANDSLACSFILHTTYGTTEVTIDV